MLQITILHTNNDTKVTEIKSIDTLTILATFDEEKGNIDLEPLRNHIGETVLISHYKKVKNEVVFDYDESKTLSKVDIDKNGVHYFEYN